MTLAVEPEPQSLWTNDDPRLHLVSWEGEGIPLLLTHGMGGNTHWWDRVAPLLAKTARPVALDFHGHGDSGWLPDSSYGVDRFVDNIENARQVLGWSKMALCGHSMGARIVLEYAARHPERVAAVAAVDFLAEALPEPSSRFARLRGKRQPIYSDPEEMARRFHLEPDGTLLTSDELRAVARHCLRKTGAGYSWRFDWKAFGFSYDAMWSVFPRVKAPVLLVRGQSSTVMSAENLSRAAGLLQGARTLEIARSHHHVPLDCPEELARAVAAFLAEAE